MTLMVQDLTNPMLAQVPHVLLAAHAGTIMGVETNAMQFYPDASRPRPPSIPASTPGATGSSTSRPSPAPASATPAPSSDATCRRRSRPDPGQPGRGTEPGAGEREREAGGTRHCLSPGGHHDLACGSIRGVTASPSPPSPRRRLGRTGLEVTVVGVGGWLGALEDPAATATVREAAGIAAVRRAVDLGITYFDTSPSYGDAERMLGRGLLTLDAAQRGRLRIATKAGTHPQRPPSIRRQLHSLVGGAQPGPAVYRPGRRAPRPRSAQRGGDGRRHGRWRGPRSPRSVEGAGRHRGHRDRRPRSRLPAPGDRERSLRRHPHAVRLLPGA